VFTVRAVQEDGWWVGMPDGVDGAVVQARQLAHIEGEACWGLARLFDLDPGGVGCDLDVDLPDELRKLVDQCWQARTQYEAAHRDFVDLHRRARNAFVEYRLGGDVSWVVLPAPPVY